MIEKAKADKDYFEQWTKEYIAHRKAEAKDVHSLFNAMEYSFFNGGKRFRPLLCFAVGEALGLKRENVVAFAAAVEMIHTYSLIHDDLPCMDDDNERRGKPTNHIQFSEDVALLAGDSLLTEAFLIVAKAYPELSADLIEKLSLAAGLSGMIRGQVLDLGKGQPTESLSDLIHLHEMKTGQLIALCFTGPGILAGRTESELYELGLHLGLAFQVKDDLLDIDENDQASFINFLGKEGTEQHLQGLTERINGQLKASSLETPFLTELIQYNFSRTK